MKRNSFLNFGSITIILVVINVLVFFGIQMQDKTKIYDYNWESNCKHCDNEPNAVYNGEYYICPESAARGNGYNINLCEKAENCCSYTLSDSFALVAKYALEKPWTFITSMFMHGSIEHLLGNMIFLLILGGMVENAIGVRSYLILYFAAGIFGGITMLFMAESGLIEDNVMILGASGAIFGVLAAAAVLKPMELIYIDFMPIPVILVGLFYIGLQVYYILNGGEEGVANGAHLGGAIIGLIFGIYFRKNFGKMFSKIKRESNY